MKIISRKILSSRDIEEIINEKTGLSFNLDEVLFWGERVGEDCAKFYSLDALLERIRGCVDCGDAKTLVILETFEKMIKELRLNEEFLIDFSW